MKNREQTIANYAEAVVDGMDLKSLICLAIDYIVDDLSDKDAYTDEDIIELVNDYDDEGQLGLIE
jgi:hypothetical protein